MKHLREELWANSLSLRPIRAGLAEIGATLSLMPARRVAARRVVSSLAMRKQNLANVVRGRMEAKGLTKYALAKESGLTRQTVGNFLTSGRAITSDKLAAMLAALDLIVVPVEGKE